MTKNITINCVREKSPHGVRLIENINKFKSICFVGNCQCCKVKTIDNCYYVFVNGGKGYSGVHLLDSLNILHENHIDIVDKINSDILLIKNSELMGYRDYIWGESIIIGMSFLLNHISSKSVYIQRNCFSDTKRNFTAEKEGFMLIKNNIRIHKYMY